MRKHFLGRLAAVVLAAAGLVSSATPASAGTLTFAVSVDGGGLIPGIQTGFDPDSSSIIVAVEAASLAINVVAGSTPGQAAGSNLHIVSFTTGVLNFDHTLDIYALDLGFVLPVAAPLVLKGTAASSTGSPVTLDSYVFDSSSVPVFPSPAGAIAAAIGAIPGTPAFDVLASSPATPYWLFAVASLTLIGDQPEGNNFDLTTSITSQDNTSTIPEPSAIIVWSVVAAVMGIPALRRRK